MNKAQTQVAEYERERRNRPDRQRAVGGSVIMINRLKPSVEEGIRRESVA